MSLLRSLGLRIDTAGARRRQAAFRTGWPAGTRDDIAFYRSPCVQYRYRERAPARDGDVDTLVLTADPPVVLEQYDELLDVFAEHFRVIVVELPAMGFSATNAGYGFGFRETNDDLAHFLSAVAGEKAVWAFSCVAGLAAVDLAARRPELCAKLVLMQVGDVAAFERWKSARDPKGILARPILGQFIMKRLAPKRLAQWFKLAVGRRDRVDEFCHCSSHALDHGALWSLASAYQVYMEPTTKLAEPQQPILALWGAADRSHAAEHAAASRNFSPNVTAVTFPDLGHFMELEDPVRVLEQIMNFLGSPAR